MLLHLFLMIFLQLKGMKFTSYIQEKYKLPAKLNPGFNGFLDLKFPERSSKLSRKRFVSKGKDYR